MTDTDKLAEYEGIIRMLTAKIEELVAENERLRAQGGAHAALKDVYLDRDLPEALRVKAAGLALAHETPRLQPVQQLDLKAEEPPEPLAVVVERQRRRADALQREARDIEVDRFGAVRILPKPGSSNGSDD
jgi:hypothetical protein